MSIIVGVILLLLVLRREPIPTPRWWWLGLIAVLLQIPVFFWGWSNWLLRAAYALLLVVAFANRHLAGGTIVMLGLLLNAIPIFIYGRMPISQDMIRWGNQIAASGDALAYSKDIVVERSVWLLLGDSIPVHVWRYRAAWSIGDIVLCLGILRFCLSSSAQDQPKRHAYETTAVWPPRNH